MSTKKIVFVSILLCALLMTGCDGIKMMQDPGYGLSEHMELPRGDLTYMPYDAIPYISWHDFVYFPWDHFDYIPWLELPYLPWENLPYLPWEKYPGFPWDELPYFPWDEVPYIPGDDIPYLSHIPDWIKTLTPPWEFIDIGCPNAQTVAMTFKTDLMDNPKLKGEDCNAKYTCTPVPEKPGWYYCTAAKGSYSYKNCPVKLCYVSGKQTICQEVNPGVSIDCISDQSTPTPVPFKCENLNQKECAMYPNICRWDGYSCRTP